MSEFRQANTDEAPAPVVEAKPIDTKSPVVTHVPELLATYAEDQGKPYVAKYLDIDTIWDKDATLRNEVETIEDYIKDQVAKGKLDNSVLAGEQFMKSLEQRANISPYETATNKISKLLAYIKFRQVVDN